MEEYKKTVESDFLAMENSETKIAERENAKNEKITKIEALSDGVYYNEDQSPYTLSLAYL